MQTFAANVERYEMQWRLAFVNELKKVGILVSKVDHALLELLWRHAVVVCLVKLLKSFQTTKIYVKRLKTLVFHLKLCRE
jgi:formyltetrahydrofolate hydrolase